MYDLLLTTYHLLPTAHYPLPYLQPDNITARLGIRDGETQLRLCAALGTLERNDSDSFGHTVSYRDREVPSYRGHDSVSYRDMEVPSDEDGWSTVAARCAFCGTCEG